MLLKTIQEVKKVLRVSSLNDGSRMPDVEAAEQAYIIPVVGIELATELQSAYDANNLTSKQKTLMGFLQKSIAAFSYHDDLALTHAIITDSGVRRTTTDNMPAVFQWEFDNLKDALSNRAMQGLEQAMAYLEANASDFSTWTASPSYAGRKSLLIKSAIDFNQQYTIGQMFQTYALLMPVIRDVESFYIEPVIGKDALDELKGITSPTTAQKPAIDSLKKAIALFTVMQAIEKLPVQISDAGLAVMSNLNNKWEKDNRVSLARSAADRDGQAYLKKAKQYMTNNASVSLFPAFFGSDYYINPATVTKTDINANRKIFIF